VQDGVPLYDVQALCCGTRASGRPSGPSEPPAPDAHDRVLKSWPSTRKMMLAHLWRTAAGSETKETGFCWWAVLDLNQ
jgi:hypothetical protein